MKTPCPPEDWYKQYFKEPYGLFYHDFLVPERMSRSEAEFVMTAVDLKACRALLDCPCGYARHFPYFETRCDCVYGLDLSADCPARAKETNPACRIVQGDMRALPFSAGKFDLVLNLFNSFGYFCDADNCRVLSEFARVMSDEGKFILDISNPESIRRIVRKTPRTRQQIGGLEVIEDWAFDDATGTLTNHGKFILGRRKVQRSYTIRLYTREEFEEITAAAGLKILRVFGGMDARPFESISSRIILLGEKRR